MRWWVWSWWLVTACCVARAASTHSLLSRLGLQRVEPPPQHRKRLAEQARRRTLHDSRLFLVKLPPSAAYYEHAGRAPPHELARTLPLALRGNGRPASVYHMNLPTLRRLAAAGAAPPPHRARLDDAPAPRAHPNAVYVPADKSFRKYFPGNGKPESFYLLRRDKPSHKHNLLP